MNSFSQKFSNSSDQALLHVMEFSDQYLPEALEAAIDELKKRNLSPEQLNSAREAAREFEATKQSKEAKKQARIDASNKQMNQAFDKIVFWKEEPKDAVFKYKLLLFLTSLSAAHGLYWTGETCYYLITGAMPGESFFYLIPAILSNLLFLVGVVLAFKRAQWGWIFLLGITFYRFITITTGLISFVGIMDEMSSDDVLYDSLIRGLLEDIGFLLLYVGIIYLLLHESVRSYFRIKAGSFMWALVVSVFVALIFIGWLFLIPMS